MAENERALLIIDEVKERKVARQEGIQIIGSPGILVIAKRKNFVESIKPIIKKIEQTNFRVSNKLIKKVLELSDEL